MVIQVNGFEIYSFSDSLIGRFRKSVSHCCFSWLKKMFMYASVISHSSDGTDWAAA